MVVGLGIGAEYYLTPFAQRPFSDLYDRFRPAGSIGLRYGIIGTVMITVGVVLYTSRKRLGALARMGKLKYWLEFHIFLCTVGPFLITLHTSFTVGGLVSIAYWSMVVVAVSGIFGRYVYVRIPKNIQGQFAGLAAIQQERASLLQSLGTALGPRAAQVEQLVAGARTPPRTLAGAIAAAVRHDFTRRRAIKRVRKLLGSGPLSSQQRSRVLGIVRRQLDVEHQIAVTLPFQKLFRYWHLLHLPLAIVMFIIVAVHVTVATMFGYGFSR
jgi:hypothetical protein